MRTEHLIAGGRRAQVVTASTLEPRHIAVSLRQVLSRTRLVLGHAQSTNRELRTLNVSAHDGDSAGQFELQWDRLLLAPGSVTREFPIPGVSDQARGVPSTPNAANV